MSEFTWERGGLRGVFGGVEGGSTSRDSARRDDDDAGCELGDEAVEAGDVGEVPTCADAMDTGLQAHGPNGALSSTELANVCMAMQMYERTHDALHTAATMPRCMEEPPKPAT